AFGVAGESAQVRFVGWPGVEQRMVDIIHRRPELHPAYGPGEGLRGVHQFIGCVAPGAHYCRRRFIRLTLPITTPKAKPPMCTHHATPPTLDGLAKRLSVPLKN